MTSHLSLHPRDCFVKKKREWEHSSCHVYWAKLQFSHVFNDCEFSTKTYRFRLHCALCMLLLCYLQPPSRIRRQHSHFNRNWSLFLVFASFSSFNVFIFAFFLSAESLSDFFLFPGGKKCTSLSARRTQTIKVKRGSRNLPGTHHFILRKLRLRNHSLKSQLLIEESALGSQVT